MSFEPLLNHKTGLQLCLLACSGNDFFSRFSAGGMNAHGPFASYDPKADGVSYTPVFHGVDLHQNRSLSNGWEALLWQMKKPPALQAARTSARAARAATGVESRISSLHREQLHAAVTCEHEFDRPIASLAHDD